MIHQSPSGILVFFLDQLSAKWLEAAGEQLPLPNIRRLQQMGTTFSNAITSNPVCCPARATVATGLNSRQHGVLENGYQLGPELPTFMQTLQDAGWRTGAFGKVHFHPHFAGLYPDYTPYGFDVTHITEDPRGGEWLDWVEREHPEHYDAALATVWAPHIPEFASYGPDNVNLRERIERIRASFQWATDEFPDNDAGAYSLPFPEEMSQTAWITGHARDFLGGLSDEQPFLAQVSYVQPHGPYCPPAEYLRLVDPDNLPEPALAEWQEDPHAPAYFESKQPSGGNWRHVRRCYFADLLHLDHQLGLVLDQLEALNRLQSTAIILLADHGDLLGDHGCYGKEERHYDACIRVPLIIAGPGLKPGQTRVEMVQLEDICPTVLDLAGQSLPPMPKLGPYLNMDAADIPQLPGRSLLPLCRGETPADWRTAAYIESYNKISSADPGDWARSIRTERYRYTLYPCGNGEQLFDLMNDPDEQNNLVADPDHAHTRTELRDQLLELIILQDYPKPRRELYALGVH
jgi:arylsulfatase